MKDEMEVRLLAVGKLTDPSFLADVASKGQKSDARLSAVDKLSDETLLEKLVTDSKVDIDVRVAALNKLTGESALARIAREVVNLHLREAAQNRLDGIRKVKRK